MEFGKPIDDTLHISVFYIFQARIKISDKPVKVLLETVVKGIPTIISCAGCYGDDESVLQWIRKPQEVSLDASRLMEL